MGDARNILVTGASSGIGLAIARARLARGDRVIGWSRDPERGGLDESVGFESRAVDLEDLASLPGFLASERDRLRDVDAVVFCAGRGLFGHLEQLSHQAIRSLVDLDFLSAVYVAKAVLPDMKERGRGDLVFIGSEASLQGKRKGSVYCAAKFALRGFAQALREECSASGVRVTSIQPGPVDTPFFEGLGFRPGEAPEHAIRPGDVAAAADVVLDAHPGTVFDEIVLSPLKRVLRFGPKEGGDEKSTLHG